MKYNFVPLSSLEELQKDHTCGTFYAVFLSYSLIAIRCYWNCQRSWAHRRNYIEGVEQDGKSLHRPCQ